MTETIYGLRVEWETRNGHYLLLSKDVPLHREDLAPLEEKMLLNVTVPRLLPLEFEQVDLSVRLRYRLPAVRTLKHFIRTQPLDAGMAVKLLYGIASIIDDSKTYMLNEEKYILQQDYIWIGQDVSDIHLAYIPLKKLEGKLPLQQELLRLSQELFELAKLPVTGYRKVIDYIKGPLFQIQEWKKILLSCLVENELPHAEPELSDRNRQAPVPLAADKTDNASFNKKTVSRSRGRIRLPSLERGTKLLLYAVIIVLAAIWAAAAAVPTQGAVLAAAGFTLLLGDGVYYKLKSSDVTVAAGEDVQPMESERPSNKERFVQPLFPPSADTYIPENQTVFLPTPGETVLLDPYMLEGEGTAALEAVRAEGNEKVMIKGDSFLIGRNKETVHWVEDTIGVSRIHLEILRKERSWMAKDLGSKNGSRLNGEVMEPFREYELKDGDRIGIACSEFYFRLQDKMMNH